MSPAILFYCSSFSATRITVDRLGVEFNDVDIANWPEYNKQTPVAQFRIAHTGSHIVIN